MDELRCVVYDRKPNFVCIVESWSNSTIPDVFLNLDGYNIICRRDREDTNEGVGGGLIIWAQSNLKVSEVCQPEFDDFNQCCSVRIHTAKVSSLNLVLVYRPHNIYRSVATVASNNEKLCDVLRAVKGQSIIIGDFNFSDIDWEMLSANNKYSRDFLETTEDCFLTQHVDFST